MRPGIGRVPHMTPIAQSTGIQLTVSELLDAPSPIMRTVDTSAEFRWVVFTATLASVVSAASHQITHENVQLVPADLHINTSIYLLLAVHRWIPAQTLD